MNSWLRQWFDGPWQSRAGGVTRRARRDVDRMASIVEVITEARARGWHVIETGDQVVVLCHDGDVRVHC